MIYIVTLLTVVLIAFGLVRQSITFPQEEWDWLLVRNIFYKPYFMLYGEVYAPEIAPCGDRGWTNLLVFCVLFLGALLRQFSKRSERIQQAMFHITVIKTWS